jgi:hypothetical protein
VRYAIARLTHTPVSPPSVTHTAIRAVTCDLTIIYVRFICTLSVCGFLRREIWIVEERDFMRRSPRLSPPLGVGGLANGV